MKIKATRCHPLQKNKKKNIGQHWLPSFHSTSIKTKICHNRHLNDCSQHLNNWPTACKHPLCRFYLNFGYSYLVYSFDGFLRIQGPTNKEHSLRSTHKSKDRCWCSTCKLPTEVYQESVRICSCKCKIDDWNIDHWRWSKRCTPLGVPTLKIYIFQK